MVAATAAARAAATAAVIAAGTATAMVVGTAARREIKNNLPTGPICARRGWPLHKTVKLRTSGAPERDGLWMSKGVGRAQTRKEELVEARREGAATRIASSHPSSRTTFCCAEQRYARSRRCTAL